VKKVKVTDLVNPVRNPVRTEPKRLINHIALVVDRSESMAPLTEKLQETLQSHVNNIKKNAFESKQETYVSIYTFSYGVERHVISQFPEAVRVPVIDCYGMTALKDAVGTAIDDLKGAKFASGPETSFLVITLTDGGENASNKYAFSVAQMIRDCQSTDRWSFAFMVPPGLRHATANMMGVPSENVQEWEASERGLETVMTAASVGTSSYFSSRSSGQTSTKAFFTDLSGVKAKDLKKLDDLSDRYRRLKVAKEAQISDFCHEKVKKYEIGRAYYELTKTEKIQDHKKLVLLDRNTDKLYGGDDARKLIGIASGRGVEVKVSPGNHAGFKIFVNSTSMNRKLVRGTELLYEKA
jgi:uncharacterized protein YegL